jgi:phosphatidylglycerophosphatase A
VTPADASSEQGDGRGGDLPRPLTALRVGIATMAGLGHAPFASGTVGTAGTIPVYLALVWPGSSLLYLSGTVAITALSIWACHVCEPRFGRKDPGQAVADEMCGFLVTMAFIPVSVGAIGAGFFLFRLTDVVKPPPARQLERLPGGWGIVADDLAAGLWANLLVHLALWSVPGLATLGALS